jgi:hypothetical protein
MIWNEGKENIKEGGLGDIFSRLDIALLRRLLGSGKRSKRKRSCIKIERAKVP